MELDLTTQVDQLIANNQASTLILWITLGVIVVALIALGTDFWANLWGAIFSPSLTFQRLLGESQWVPAIVIIAIIGLACSVIVNNYMGKEEVIQNIFDQISMDNPAAQQMFGQFDNLADQIGSDFTLSGNIDYVKEYAFQTQSIAVALPVWLIVLWLVWALSGQLGSMIAGNKAGHGLSNLLSALPYIFMVWILTAWFTMLDLAGSAAGRILYLIFNLYFLFLHVVLMREHGRYDIGKSIVATILTLILVPVFLVVLFVLILFIMVQVDTYM